MARGFRSVTRGLAPMDSVRGTFIAYSTSPGSVAADGTGKNSPYTAALAQTIVQPGVGIEEAFREVRAQVMAATEEKQVPWDSSSLTAPFFFTPGSAKPASAQPAPTVPGTSNFAAEKAVWEAIADSKQPSDYKAYLSQYPHGTYAGLARSRLASLGGHAEPEQPQPPKVVPAAATAPAPAPEPAPVATDASVRSEPEDNDAPATGKKIELDSRGVDCRILDSTRPASDCKNTKRFAPANKPNRR
jgi:uncharacterized caspase-like protein